MATRRYTNDELNLIYDRTSGYCHICHRKLAFCNYAIQGAKGAWEVEHSCARANGGTDRLCNLYAACIACNRSKGTRTTRSVRAWNGTTRAPLSVAKRREAKRSRALAAATLGFAAGSVFGPLGALTGALVGAAMGERGNPDR
jgi:5-methylcytosine-specific restriction endonuclease McrA